MKTVKHILFQTANTNPLYAERGLLYVEDGICSYIDEPCQVKADEIVEIPYEYTDFHSSKTRNRAIRIKHKYKDKITELRRKFDNE